MALLRGFRSPPASRLVIRFRFGGWRLHGVRVTEDCPDVAALTAPRAGEAPRSSPQATAPYSVILGYTYKFAEVRTFRFLYAQYATSIHIDKGF